MATTFEIGKAQQPNGDSVLVLKFVQLAKPVEVLRVLRSTFPEEYQAVAREIVTPNGVARPLPPPDQSAGS